MNLSGIVKIPSDYVAVLRAARPLSAAGRPPAADAGGLGTSSLAGLCRRELRWNEGGRAQRLVLLA